HTGNRVVHALAALVGTSAGAAGELAPSLAARAADAEAAMAVRLRFAIALAVAVGEHGPAEELAAAADPREALTVDGFAAEHGVAREPLAARIRGLARADGRSERPGPSATGAAAALHRLTRETAAPLAVVRRELDDNPLSQEAISLAGRLGPAAAEAAPALRSAPV